MNIHEYQAKELFRQYGIPTDRFILAKSPDDVKKSAEEIGGVTVVKAQVLTGGRGKAGGVKVAATPAEADRLGRSIFGLDIKGYTVEKVIVSEAADITKEFYAGFVTNRNTRMVTLMLSSEGGVEIEELAVTDPDKIFKIDYHPETGADRETYNKALKTVFKEEPFIGEADDILSRLYRLFTEKDCSLAEINPLAIVGNKALRALDAKVNFDDNALYRHSDIKALENEEESSADEREAREAGLSFVSLDGDIGCIVNGAGLAMATLDIIKLYGGSPANFLDVGGSSNPNKVLTALNIITRNTGVKAILINIFGGITRCDDIARGLLLAKQQIEIKQPIVIRLIGTNQEEGRRLLEEAGMEAFDDLSLSVETVVRLAGGGSL